MDSCVYIALRYTLLDEIKVLNSAQYIHTYIFILFQKSTFGGTASRYRTRQLNCTFKVIICIKLNIQNILKDS
jgi:hypothetical protein